MKYIDFLNLKKLNEEKFDNIFQEKTKLKILDEVYDMIEKSYLPIGGTSFKNKDDLLYDTSLWKLVYKNGKIVCGRIYKDKYGRKSIASFTDGSNIGKKSLYNMMKEDMSYNRAWAEVSGKMEHIYIKKCNAEKVPNIFAEIILDKEILSLNSDGFHYTRFINGVPKEKIIIVGDKDKFLKMIEKSNIY